MYELFYIIPAKYTDDEVQGVTSRVTSLLEKNGATVVTANALGKQKLAYPIKKFRFGHEFLIDFNADKAALLPIQGELRIDSSITRFMLSHKSTKAKKLNLEERPRTREQKPQAEARAPKAQVPAISEEQLEKRIEEVLEEPVV